MGASRTTVLSSDGGRRHTRSLHVRSPDCVRGVRADTSYMKATPFASTHFYQHEARGRTVSLCTAMEKRQSRGDGLFNASVPVVSYCMYVVLSLHGPFHAALHGSGRLAGHSRDHLPGVRGEQKGERARGMVDISTSTSTL